MVKSLIGWLKVQLDKFHPGHGIAVAQWGYGRWFVRYNDGSESVTMLYRTARDYAEIFGGEVLHVSKREGQG